MVGSFHDNVLIHNICAWKSDTSKSLQVSVPRCVILHSVVVRQHEILHRYISLQKSSGSSLNLAKKKTAYMYLL